MQGLPTLSNVKSIYRTICRRGCLEIKASSWPGRVQELHRKLKQGHPAHLHTVGRGLSELVLIDLERVCSEDIGVLATHALELLKQLRLVLSKVKGLHRARGRVGHDRHPHGGHLGTAAAEPLHLADSIQDGIHLGLEALLAHKYILIS